MHGSLRVVVLFAVLIALALALVVQMTAAPPAPELDEKLLTIVQIVGADGEPVPSAVVEDQRGRHRVDGRGQHRTVAPPGTYWMRVYAPGHAVATAVVRSPGKGTVALEKEAVIFGRVVQGDSLDPVPNAYVLLTGIAIESAATDLNGAFRFDMLSPGPYEITVRAKGWAALPDAEIEVDRGRPKEVLIRAKPALSVSAEVIADETGTPCKSSYIVLRSAIDLAEMRGDEHGRVVIDGLLPGRYRVKVHCNELGDAEYELALEERSLEGIRWIMPRAIRIRGSVLDPSGARKTGSRVLSQRLGSRDPIVAGAVTDREGRFELRVPRRGSYRLTCMDGSRASVSLRVADEDLDGVVLQERAVPTATIEGLLTAPDARPLPKVRLAIEEPYGEARLEATTDADGRFRFEVKAETLSIRVADTGLAIRGWHGEANIMPAPNAITRVRLVAAPTDGAIRGRVVEGRESFAGVIVEAMREAGGDVFGGVTEGWVHPIAEAVTDADGRFELTGLPADRYRVRARRAGGGQAIARDVAPGAEIDLVIREPGAILGRAVGIDPVPRLAIRATHLTDEYSRTSKLTVASGAFALRELPPGRYRITVRGEGVGGWTEVEIGAGQDLRDVEIPLLRTAPLSGRIVSAESGKGIADCSVHLEGEPETAFFEAGIDGDFELADVGAGPRTLGVSCIDQDGDGTYCGGRVAFEVPGERPLILPPIELPRVEGPGLGPANLGIELRGNEVIRIQPSTPAEKGGIVAGDRIAKVRGFDVRVHPELLECLLDAYSGQKVELELERGPRIALEGW